jgi:hypothetical protein
VYISLVDKGILAAADPAVHEDKAPSSMPPAHAHAHAAPPPPPPSYIPFALHCAESKYIPYKAAARMVIAASDELSSEATRSTQTPA